MARLVQLHPNLYKLTASQLTCLTYATLMSLGMGSAGGLAWLLYHAVQHPPSPLLLLGEVATLGVLLSLLALGFAAFPLLRPRTILISKEGISLLQGGRPRHIPYSKIKLNASYSRWRNNLVMDLAVWGNGTFIQFSDDSTEWMMVRHFILAKIPKDPPTPLRWGGIVKKAHRFHKRIVRRVNFFLYLGNFAEASAVVGVFCLLPSTTHQNAPHIVPLALGIAGLASAIGFLSWHQALKLFQREQRLTALLLQSITWNNLPFLLSQLTFLSNKRVRMPGEEALRVWPCLGARAAIQKIIDALPERDSPALLAQTYRQINDMLQSQKSPPSPHGRALLLTTCLGITLIILLLFAITLLILGALAQVAGVFGCSQNSSNDDYGSNDFIYYHWVEDGAANEKSRTRNEEAVYQDSYTREVLCNLLEKCDPTRPHPNPTIARNSLLNHSGGLSS